jgi:hypothetical protein
MNTEQQVKLRILVPVGTFLVTLIGSYLYFCVAFHFMNRRKLFK